MKEEKTSVFMIDAVFELTLHLSLRVCELRASAASSKGHKTSNSLNLKCRKKVYQSSWWLSLPLSPATLSLLPDAAVPAPTTRTRWLSSSTLKLQVWGEGNRWAKMPKQSHLRTARCRTPGGQSHFFFSECCNMTSGICPRGSQRQFYFHIFFWTPDRRTFLFL